MIVLPDVVDFFLQGCHEIQTKYQQLTPYDDQYENIYKKKTVGAHQYLDQNHFIEVL